MSAKVCQALHAEQNHEASPVAFERLKVLVVGNNAVRDTVAQVVDPDYATIYMAYNEEEAIGLIGRGTIPDLLITAGELEALHLDLIAEGIDEVVPELVLQPAKINPVEVRRAASAYLPEYVFSAK